MTTGAALLCRALEAHDVRAAFGVPGTQNLALHEALRRSRVRVVLSTHELAAGFMSIGYYLASGRLAPLVTIPGPGFTWAATALAEARHDSAALLHIVGPHTGADSRRGFQSLDHLAVAAPMVKATRRIETLAEVEPVLEDAIRLAVSGEPGPVVVEWKREALERRGKAPGSDSRRTPEPAALKDVGSVAAWLAGSRRPLLYLGRGALAAGDGLRELAEWLGAPIVTTLSGRGVVPEDHHLVVAHDVGCGSIPELNRLLRRADAILALGCRLAASATADFRVRLPHEAVVHVDASPEPPGCPVSRSLTAEAQAFVPALLAALRALRAPAPGWPAAEVERARRDVRRDTWPEPAIHGASPATAAAFFAALRSALPREAIVVADSGNHQMLLRRHYDVLCPRGLIVPSDFQSMGFALPAAIGAKLAAPERPVLALIGDGGFAMSGLELLTAVREQIPLTLVVFADRHLNRIRLEQLARFGRSSATTLHNPDFEAVARAVGARYFRCDGDARAVLREATRGSAVNLVEVPVGDSAAVHLARARGFAVETARRTLQPEVLEALRGARPEPD